MRLDEPTRLPEDWVSPCAKKFQGSSPANEKRGYGSPSEPTLASRPKKIVKTIIVITGWSTAHATPSAVCL